MYLLNQFYFKDYIMTQTQLSKLDLDNTSYIELHFQNGESVLILPNKTCRGICRGNSRAMGFTWYNSHLTKITTKLIYWLHTEFRWLFNSDDFLWSISICTASKELQSYLKEVKP